MKIVGLSGSLRQGSYNTLLLNAAAELLTEGVELQVYEYADVPMYIEDLDGAARPVPVRRMLEAISTADAVLFATPEYNHSISGVLKNAIDWASRPAFESVLTGKPAGVLSASMSPIGGARAQQHLKLILAATLTPVYTVNEYLLPLAQQAFDEQGRLTDETARRRLQRYMHGLADWVPTVSRSD
jgi:chromate reductase